MGGGFGSKLLSLIPLSRARNQMKTRRALSWISSNIKVGGDAAAAVNLLEQNGFHCRELTDGRWNYADKSITRMISCHLRTEWDIVSVGTVYANLGLDSEGEILHVASDVSRTSL